MSGGADDEEVGRFIEGAPASLTFSELARECRARFGDDRAWSEDRIARHWHRLHKAPKGRPSRLDKDGEVRAFVDDRAGRHTLDEIVAACRERFGAKRAPSRSAVHRHWSRLRAKARSARPANGPANGR